MNKVVPFSDDTWLNIFSYVSVSFSDVSDFRVLSKYFENLLFKYLKAKMSVFYKEISSIKPFDLNDSFWDGFENHFPVWREDLKTKDVFSLHLCKSLEKCDEDDSRTDRVLCYLAKRKPYIVGNPLQEKYEEFLKSFCHFIWLNLNQPHLYGFLLLCLESSIESSEASSFTELMHQNYFDPSHRLGLINESFIVFFNDLLYISRWDPTGKLERRLFGLNLIHSNPYYVAWIHSLRGLALGLLSSCFFLALSLLHDPFYYERAIILMFVTATMYSIAMVVVSFLPNVTLFMLLALDELLHANKRLCK